MAADQLDLAYLGTGPDPCGGQRAAFRATAELHRKDFAIDWNQSAAAGVALVGRVLQITLDIEAAQGDLPEASPGTLREPGETSQLDRLSLP